MSDNKPETMELTTKPEVNFASMVKYKASEIMSVAARNVQLDKNWLERAKMELMAKPDTAKVCLTKSGMDSVLKALKKAATAGITFGGIRPQAYFTPSDNGSTVRLDVSQFGYAHAAVYGPGGVLSQVPQLITVHQNDGTRVDQAKGKLIYPEGGIDPLSDRGAIAWYAMELRYKDGRPDEVRYITMVDVRKIEEGHGNLNSPAYKKDRAQMDEKTAVKQILKWAFGESEGNAQNILDALDYEPEPAIERDPARRMESRMERAAATMKPAERVDETEAEPESETAGESGDQPSTEAAQPGAEELF